MADQSIIQQTRQAMEARLKELQPVIAEADEIRSVLAALDSAEKPTRKSSDGTTRRRGRRKTPSGRAARGQRREQLLSLVAESPGIRNSEAANNLGVAPAQISSLAKKLADDGEIERREGALYPRRADDYPKGNG